MNKQSERAKPYPTVLTIVTGFLVIYFFAGWEWTLITAFLLGLGSILSIRFTEFIHWVWMEIARWLGLVIPKFILTIVYYAVLVPVAALSKIFRKETPVILENNRKSMFRNMKKTFKKEDFLRPW